MAFSPITHTALADRSHRPRVVIVQKSDGILTWRMDLEQAFRDAGAETGLLQFRPQSLAEQWAQRLGGQRLLANPATLRRLAKSLAAFSPDLVLVLNYPGLPAPAAAAIRKALRPGVPVIGWLCDNPEVFPRDLEPTLDGVYTFDSACVPLLEERYRGTSARLDFLPLAASPVRYRCPGIDLRGRRPGMAFAGNCTHSRQVFFAACRGLGNPPDLFGPHAGNAGRFWRNRKLSSAALGRVYRKYLVNLNLLQPGNTTNGLNLRAFEIPCAGGLGTYPDVPDLVGCFRPGEEILVYTSAEHLADLAAGLRQNPDHALAITRAGHLRVMREHTFYHRATRILSDWYDPAFCPARPDYLPPPP